MSDGSEIGYDSPVAHANDTHEKGRAQEFALAVRSALDRMATPTTVTTLRKALPKPFREKPDVLRAVLEALVDDGQVFASGTTKAPRYSTSDPRAQVRDLLPRLLEPRPLPIKQLSKLLKAELGFAVSQEVVEGAVRQLVAEGRLHVLGTKSSPVYSLEKPAAVVSRALLDVLHAEPQAKSALQRTLKKQLGFTVAGELDPVLSDFMERSVVFAHPKRSAAGMPGKSIAGYALEPPPPVPARLFLKGTLAALEKAAKQAATHGVSLEELIAALRDEVLGKASKAGSSSAAFGTGGDSSLVLAEVVRQLSKERSGTLLPVRQVRAQFDWGKARFDQAVVALSRSSQIILHHHDHPQSLPEEEREGLVADGQGTHYVGVALRRQP